MRREPPDSRGDRPVLPVPWLRALDLGGLFTGLAAAAVSLLFTGAAWWALFPPPPKPQVVHQIGLSSRPSPDPPRPFEPPLVLSPGALAPMERPASPAAARLYPEGIPPALLERALPGLRFPAVVVPRPELADALVGFTPPRGEPERPARALRPTQIRIRIPRPAADGSFGPGMAGALGSGTSRPGNPARPRASPIVGARHDYRDSEPRVLGTRRPVPAEPRAGGAAGGGLPMLWEPGERTITDVRLVPPLVVMEAGYCQEFDLQIQLDRRDWISVTERFETTFRLRAPATYRVRESEAREAEDRVDAREYGLDAGIGLVPHRRNKNVFCCPLGTPERFHGDRIIVEGTWNPRDLRPLTARAVVILRLRE